MFDWDLLSANDSMGQIVIEIDSLNNGRNDVWLDFKKTGSVHLVIEAIGFGLNNQKIKYKAHGSFEKNLMKSFKEDLKDLKKDYKDNVKEPLKEMKDFGKDIKDLGKDINKVFKGFF